MDKLKTFFFSGGCILFTISFIITTFDMYCYIRVQKWILKTAPLERPLFFDKFGFWASCLSIVFLQPLEHELNPFLISGNLILLIYMYHRVRFFCFLT